MRPYAIVGVLLLPLTILLAGRPAHAADPSVSLELKGHHFTPTGITIPANTRVRFLVKNLDPTPAEFESDDFKAEKVVPSGQQVTIFVGPLQAGTYEFHDEYNEDVSKTHLVVK